MGNIKDIEGIGPAYAEKLEAAGIKTEEALLAAGGEAKGRADLAAKTGLSEKQLLEWVNRADLARVHGIGGQYADLLEASGVDTVPELAQRNAQSLHAKMEEVNAAKNLVNRVPSLAEVEKWVAEAKTLPRAVNY
jgi:predicted flap endonuclease-1-like 5' DNA nuclease